MKKVFALLYLPAFAMAGSLAALTSVSADHMPVEPYDLFRDPPEAHELPAEERSVLDDPVITEPPVSPVERAIREQEAEEREQEARRAVVQDYVARTQLPPLPDDREERLATLFDVLKKNRSETQAQRAVAEIERIWMDSGSDTIDLLMEWSRAATQRRDFGAALDYLDNVVRLAPDFVEGWNKRATVHYMKRDFGRSIADVEQTLELEPRHFGALSGLGFMLRELGREQEALTMLERAYELNPTSDSVKETLDTLRLKVGGRDI